MVKQLQALKYCEATLVACVMKLGVAVGVWESVAQKSAAGVGVCLKALYSQKDHELDDEPKQ